MNQPIAFVDTETTGMNPMYDRVIEIGIVRLEPNGAIQEYQTLIDPDMNIPFELTAIHGISNEDIHSAPTFRDVVEEIHELLDGAIFAAHNARFDYSFLKQSYKRLNVPFNYTYVDTVKISRLLYPTHARHSVDALVARFGFQVNNRHRALPDAQVLFQFYQQAIHDHGQELVSETIKKAMAKPMIPASVPHNLIDSLPEGPGIYKMYDNAGTIIYIGKSKNIKSRILQHFSQDMVQTKERKLSSMIANIETIQTAGETGALLLESQLIKQHLPIYNRMLRTSNNMILITTDKVSDYHTLKTDLLKDINQYQSQDILAITKSSRAAKTLIAKLADTHQLCKKVLGIEKGTGPCFAYHLSRCKGACLKKESAQLHNLRLELAFTKTKLKSWSYGKPITIKEINPKTNHVDIFTIDNWSLVEHITSKDGENFERSSYEPHFDYDTYKILIRHLSSKHLSSNRNTPQE